jgi:hypothetical protein
MADAPTTISRDDLESSFRAFKDDIDRSADDAANKAVPVAVVGGIVILILAYLIGKRVGKKKSTVVEIRRI